MFTKTEACAKNKTSGKKERVRNGSLFFVRVYMEEAKLLKNLSYFPYKKKKEEKERK